MGSTITLTLPIIENHEKNDGLAHPLFLSKGLGALPTDSDVEDRTRQIYLFCEAI